jgi:hypothetical protein
MTREQLEAWATRHGWERDAYGHYHKGEMRLKMQKRTVRYERGWKTTATEYSRSEKRWTLRWSGFYSQLSLNAEDQLVPPTKTPMMDRIVSAS